MKHAIPALFVPVGINHSARYDRPVKLVFCPYQCWYLLIAPHTAVLLYHDVGLDGTFGSYWLGAGMLSGVKSRG